MIDLKTQKLFDDMTFIYDREGLTGLRVIEKENQQKEELTTLLMIAFMTERLRTVPFIEGVLIGTNYVYLELAIGNKKTKMKVNLMDDDFEENLGFVFDHQGMMDPWMDFFDDFRKMHGSFQDEMIVMSEFGKLDHFYFLNFWHQSNYLNEGEKICFEFIKNMAHDFYDEALDRFNRHVYKDAFEQPNKTKDLQKKKM